MSSEARYARNNGPHVEGLFDEEAHKTVEPEKAEESEPRDALLKAAEGEAGAAGKRGAHTIEDTLDRWDREDREDREDRQRRAEERRQRESAPGYVRPATTAELEEIAWTHNVWPGGMY